MGKATDIHIQMKTRPTERSDKPFRYETCCLYARGEDINEMRDHPKCREITYQTFRKRCWGVQYWSILMGYDRQLPLSKDKHVAFYKLFYRGCRCYYIVHSAIEWIWTERSCD